MDAPSSVSIRTEASPTPSVPAWFGEVALLAHTLTRLGLLADISERVRFPRDTQRVENKRAKSGSREVSEHVEGEQMRKLKG